MPIFAIVVAIVGVAVVRYPIIDRLAGWLVVVPLVTVASGSIAWSLLIQRWDSLYSLRGYEVTLAACSVPVVLWVARMDRS